jgi:hypothetical protein
VRKSKLDYSEKFAMKNFNSSRRCWQLAAACMLFSSVAHAQYIWIDETGRKQLSDRPPPASTPAKNILKAPGLAASNAVTPAPGAAPATDAAPSVAEREADYRKRSQEKAEQDKKRAEQARVNAHNAQACATAAAIKASLASGERVALVDKNGEHVMLNDAMRAQRSAQAADVLSKCK